MTDKVDAQKFFILEKHAVVTLALEGVSAINCTDYDMVPGIIGELEITSSRGKGTKVTVLLPCNGEST